MKNTKSVKNGKISKARLNYLMGYKAASFTPTNMYRSRNDNQSWSFICKPEDVKKARKLLEDINILTMYSALEQTRIIESKNGEIVQVKGREIVAFCPKDKFKVMLDVLSKNKIAGYSRETQIILKQDYTNINN